MSSLQQIERERLAYYHAPTHTEHTVGKVAMNLVTEEGMPAYLHPLAELTAPLEEVVKWPSMVAYHFARAEHGAMDDLALGVWSWYYAERQKTIAELKKKGLA